MTMTIAIIGAAGRLGKILTELGLARGHKIIALSRTIKDGDFPEAAKAIACSASDLDKLTAGIKGADVLLSVFPPTLKNPAEYCRDIQNTIDACKADGVARLIGLVGSSACIVNTGERLVDTDYFAEGTRHFYENICASVDVYEKEKELDWVVYHPAATMDPGLNSKGRRYITGDEHLVVTDPNSRMYFSVSEISYADMAQAMLDEAENPKHSRQRVSVAYE